MNGALKSFLKAAAAAVFWLGVWYLLAHAVGLRLLLPSPGETIARLAELAGEGSFWLVSLSSLLRVFAGIAAGVAAGVVTAVLTSRYAVADILLTPLLAVIKATPVASFIILAILWIGKQNVPFFIAFLMVLPIMWSNVAGGIASADRELIEVAQVFRITRLTRLRRLWLPSVMPYFISGCRSALGIAWKAGVAAEVLANTKNSIGGMLYESKLYLETTDLFAWTAVVIILSVIIERALLAALKPGGRRVRHAEA